MTTFRDRLLPADLFVPDHEGQPAHPFTSYNPYPELGPIHPHPIKRWQSLAD